MSMLLVHEWISPTGGSERVFDRMVDAFPEARVLCLWNDDHDRYPGRTVEQTWLARTPLRRHKPLALAASVLAWRGVDTSDADVVLVSSHAFAHHVGRHARARHGRKLVYVHTPARYLWARDQDARGGVAASVLAAPALRSIDRSRADAATEYVANSHFVRRRIESAWHRDARVIHPPVAVERIQEARSWADRVVGDERAVLDRLPETFLLGVSRFIGYKRLDLVVAAGEAAGLPVVLAGAGPEEEALRQRGAEAIVPVTIVRRPSDELLYALYERALALVFPAVEDFGIVPVEAMACGTPVVVNAAGGAPEAVMPPAGGVAVHRFTRTELADAVAGAAALDRAGVAVHARRFSTRRFDAELRGWVTGRRDTVDDPQVGPAPGTDRG
ncbi:glycosyltransferase [Cellulomonas sp.]|uniref:glycosyltransferase n=1 Tax=Cellulomonas sp. TaxID=40001 RepID=UPI001B0CDB40|nr:glycosyltransferase [Cellulomonas sp.]MBO9553126.1 glycosyltransferase [Cellulomonas sp.]